MTVLETTETESMLHWRRIDKARNAESENVYMMLSWKASWVSTEGDAKDPHFEEGPSMSLAGWRDARGLCSTSND